MKTIVFAGGLALLGTLLGTRLAISFLVKKGYGHAFLQALPRCRRLESVSELGPFFAERPSAALPGARANLVAPTPPNTDTRSGRR